jgi:hypothetical protein
MYFDTKSYLKSNHYHTPKHPSLVSFYFIYSILAPPTPSQFSSTTAVPSNKNFSPTLMLHHHRKTLPP